jgi:hypothetical protein
MAAAAFATVKRWLGLGGGDEGGPPCAAPRGAATPVLADVAAPRVASRAFAGQGVPRPAYVDSDGDEADGFVGEDGVASAGKPRR